MKKKTSMGAKLLLAIYTKIVHWVLQCVCVEQGKKKMREHKKEN